MSDHSSEREAHTTRHEADALPPGQRESRTGQKLTPLWHDGALFHVSTRHPRRPDVARVDRLAGILRKGLIAPASCPDGSVCSDLHLTVTGTDLPYDSLVFLHRFGPPSFLYIPVEPGRFAVFVAPELPVLTPEAMGTRWVVLSQDEVYVQDRVAPEDLIGVAVHRVEADAVMRELMADFQRLGIPLYDYEGNALWQPAR
jgi:hypothetical protein